MLINWCRCGPLLDGQGKRAVTRSGRLSPVFVEQLKLPVIPTTTVEAIGCTLTKPCSQRGNCAFAILTGSDGCAL